MNLVDKIRDIAVKKNETLESLGRNSGIGEKAIYRWDRKPPNIATLKKVTDYLQISIKDILE